MRVLDRLLACCVLTTFVSTTVFPSPASAQLLPTAPAALPAPGTMVNVSPVYAPTLIKGLTIDPNNPFKFEFLMDTGDSGLQGEALQAESYKMIKYFMASLANPEKDMWVNLSPYEKDRIIPDVFGRTEMGRDLLSQDYILKQLTATLMSPEGELGKKFWERVYEKIYEQNIPSPLWGGLGRGNPSTEDPHPASPMKGEERSVSDLVESFNKVWIVPQTGYFYEHDNSVFIVDAKLKVMLEEDYVAAQKAVGAESYGLDSRSVSLRGDEGDEAIPNKNNFDEMASQKTLAMTERKNDVKDIMRSIIIPVIEDEVNNGRNFANLRQIYNAMLLSVWFKRRLKDHILGQAYADKEQINSIALNTSGEIEGIWNQYVEAFKTGVYNTIKEEYDPQTQTVVPHKYFSGGAKALTDLGSLDASGAQSVADHWKNGFREVVDFQPVNRAMLEESLTKFSRTYVSAYSLREGATNLTRLVWDRAQYLHGGHLQRVLQLAFENAAIHGSFDFDHRPESIDVEAWIDHELQDIHIKITNNLYKTPLYEPIRNKIFDKNSVYEVDHDLRDQDRGYFGAAIGLMLESLASLYVVTTDKLATMSWSEVDGEDAKKRVVFELKIPMVETKGESGDTASSDNRAMLEDPRDIGGMYWYLVVHDPTFDGSLNPFDGVDGPKIEKAYQAFRQHENEMIRANEAEAHISWAEREAAPYIALLKRQKDQHGHYLLDTQMQSEGILALYHKLQAAGWVSMTHGRHVQDFEFVPDSRDPWGGGDKYYFKEIDHAMMARESRADSPAFEVLSPHAGVRTVKDLDDFLWLNRNSKLDGVTLQMLVLAFNVDETTVNNYLRKHDVGIEKAPGHTGNDHAAEITTKMRAELDSHIQGGFIPFNVYELSKRYGLSVSTISNFLYLLAVPFQYKESNFEGAQRLADDFKTLAADLRRSQKPRVLPKTEERYAKEYDVSLSTVGNKAREAGLKTQWALAQERVLKARNFLRGYERRVYPGSRLALAQKLGISDKVIRRIVNDLHVTFIRNFIDTSLAMRTWAKRNKGKTIEFFDAELFEMFGIQRDKVAQKLFREYLVRYQVNTFGGGKTENVIPLVRFLRKNKGRFVNVSKTELEKSYGVHFLVVQKWLDYFHVMVRQDLKTMEWVKRVVLPRYENQSYPGRYTLLAKRLGLHEETLRKAAKELNIVFLNGSSENFVFSSVDQTVVIPLKNSDPQEIIESVRKAYIEGYPVDEWNLVANQAAEIFQSTDRREIRVHVVIPENGQASYEILDRPTSADVNHAMMADEDARKDILIDAISVLTFSLEDKDKEFLRSLNLSQIEAFQDFVEELAPDQLKGFEGYFKLLWDFYQSSENEDQMFFKNWLDPAVQFRKMQIIVKVISRSSAMAHVVSSITEDTLQNAAQHYAQGKNAEEIEEFYAFLVVIAGSEAAEAFRLIKDYQRYEYGSVFEAYARIAQRFRSGEAVGEEMKTVYLAFNDEFSMDFFKNIQDQPGFGSFFVNHLYSFVTSDRAEALKGLLRYLVKNPSPQNFLWAYVAVFMSLDGYADRTDDQQFLKDQLSPEGDDVMIDIVDSRDARAFQSLQAPLQDEHEEIASRIQPLLLEGTWRLIQLRDDIFQKNSGEWILIHQTDFAKVAELLKLISPDAPGNGEFGNDNAQLSRPDDQDEEKRKLLLKVLDMDDIGLSLNTLMLLYERDTGYPVEDWDFEWTLLGLSGYADDLVWDIGEATLRSLEWGERAQRLKDILDEYRDDFTGENYSLAYNLYQQMISGNFQTADPESVLRANIESLLRDQEALNEEALDSTNDDAMMTQRQEHLRSLFYLTGNDASVYENLTDKQVAKELDIAYYNWSLYESYRGTLQNYYRKYYQGEPPHDIQELENKLNAVQERLAEDIWATVNKISDIFCPRPPTRDEDYYSDTGMLVVITYLLKTRNASADWNRGGVNLRSDQADIQIQTSENGFKFPKLDPAMFKGSPGDLVPVILEIAPMPRPEVLQRLGLALPEEHPATAGVDIPGEKAKEPEKVVLN